MLTASIVVGARLLVASHFHGGLPFGGQLLLHLALGFLCLPCPDRCKERLEVEEEVIFGDSEVPLKETEKLLLHKVDFSQAEAEVVVAADGSVASPVLVLGRRVVEVLGCQDEGSQEDAVDCAAHALGHWWQALPKAVEIYQGGHECRDLNVRARHERVDELLDRRQRWVGVVLWWCRRGSRRQALVDRCLAFATNDL